MTPALTKERSCVVSGAFFWVLVGIFSVVGKYSCMLHTITMIFRTKAACERQRDHSKLRMAKPGAHDHPLVRQKKQSERRQDHSNRNVKYVCASLDMISKIFSKMQSWSGWLLKRQFFQKLLCPCAHNRWKCAVSISQLRRGKVKKKKKPYANFFSFMDFVTSANLRKLVFTNQVTFWSTKVSSLWTDCCENWHLIC